jgi:uncharacterized membrane protein YhaH (DUF805 family)
MKTNNEENYEAFRKKMNRAEFWITLGFGLLLIALLSSCTFRQEIPLGKGGDWGVVYVGYSPPLGRLFSQRAKDVPDPELPEWKAVVEPEQ